MKFNLHPWMYHVRICPGVLLHDGVPVAATAHGREILLCGTLKPHDRTEALIDQLRRLHEKHHGPLEPIGVPSFTADVMRQLLSQGGEPVLMRLRPDNAGAASGASAEPSEQEVKEMLAAELPDDAVIVVQRSGWVHSRSRTVVTWVVRIEHEETGYLKTLPAKAGTAGGAIDGALRKWRVHMRRFSRDGVPRWIPDPRKPSLLVRVRLAPGRLFVRQDGFAREVASLVDGRTVMISRQVPPQHRRSTLLAALVA